MHNTSKHNHRHILFLNNITGRTFDSQYIKTDKSLSVVLHLPPINLKPKAKASSIKKSNFVNYYDLFQNYYVCKRKIT